MLEPTSATFEGWDANLVAAFGERIQVPPRRGWIDDVPRRPHFATAPPPKAFIMAAKSSASDRLFTTCTT